MDKTYLQTESLVLLQMLKCDNKEEGWAGSRFSPPGPSTVNTREQKRKAEVAAPEISVICSHPLGKTVA